jgi:hypothetical protein
MYRCSLNKEKNAIENSHSFPPSPQCNSSSACPLDSDPLLHTPTIMSLNEYDPYFRKFSSCNICMHVRVSLFLDCFFIGKALFEKLLAAGVSARLQILGGTMHASHIQGGSM